VSPLLVIETAARFSLVAGVFLDLFDEFGERARLVVFNIIFAAQFEQTLL